MNKPVNKGKKKKSKPPFLPNLLKLGSYARDHCKKIAGVMAAVLVSTAMGLIPPWLIRYGIDNMIMTGDIQRLWIIAAAMIGTALLKGFFDFVKSYVSEFIAQSIIHDIRVNLYEHLNKLSFSFYDESRTGDLMARITTDTETLHRFLGRVSSFVSENILTIIGILIIMLFWDYRLGLLYIAILPLMVFGMYMYSSKVRPMFRKVRKTFAKLTEMVQENFVGMEVIKLFGREDQQKRKFNKRNQEYVDINIKASKVSALWMPYVHFLVGLSTALVVWYGGRLVIKGTISLGMMAGFLSYIAMLTRPVRQTGMMINLSSQAVAASERIFDVLDMSPEVKDSPDAKDLPPVDGKVEFKDVSFSYKEGKQVLKDIDIDVKPGETVAIVGPTGAGKSTLLHLIPRFYDADEGKILIDGHDIKEVTIDSLREQVGIVLQHTFLFGASIRENISYGRPDAPMDEVIECAKIAQIHDFIESLPLGYETPIGERGVDISGGQKQRLAMARVLLTDPSLLILDEPTSSVDVETEDKMQKAMSGVIKDRTTFVIAHRLWTVQNADKILVLKDGGIVERGKHEELLEKEDGFYRKIYQQVLKEEEGDSR
ncbi:MAG: ABC transporter ATP-binding protein [Candidatus Thermoplasmatota archaeon]